MNTPMNPDGLPISKNDRRGPKGSGSLIDPVTFRPSESMEINPLFKEKKKLRGVRDWQRTGITPQPIGYADLRANVERQMAVWETRIESKRYDELARGVQDLEEGLTEAHTYYAEQHSLPGERTAEELRAEVKARLKLHRAYGIWKDHANDSMEDIREAEEKAEVKLDGEFFDTLFCRSTFKHQLGDLMRTAARPDFTDDQMTQNLQERMGAVGAEHTTVVDARLAWEIFTVTAAAAETGDPDIENSNEFRGVKKVMNPRRGAYLDRGLSGTVDPIEFALLDQEVESVELKDERGNIIGHEGRRLDGTMKTIGDYLGVHNFFLFLSEYEGGRFWREQNTSVVRAVIDRHRTFRDATHPNGIIELNPDGTPRRDSAGNFIPIAVPINNEDLALVDWDNVQGHNGSGEILMGEAYATWLDYCRKSEWSRKYIAVDILPSLGSPDTIKLIAEAAGEVEQSKKDKPLFQRHVPYEMKIFLVDTMKSMVCQRFIRIIEQGMPRDVNLQKLLNQEIYRYGGDALRLRKLFKRSFSNEALNKEPISISQAASYLRMIYADDTPINFGSYTPFIDADMPTPTISARRVLERAAASYGWEPETPGQTFYVWLDTIRNDPRFSDWSWRVDQKDNMSAQLRNDYTAARRAGNAVDARKASNLIMFMGHFVEPEYQFSAFQRDFYEFVIRDGINYFKTSEDNLYDRFVQHEIIYRHLLNGLRRFTPNDPLPGDRMLEVTAGAIMKANPGDMNYAAPADRDATNHPIWWEGDDRRRLWELIMYGTLKYINKRYTEKGYNLPRHPKTKALLSPWQLADNCEDRAMIMEVFERKGRVGQGFLKPETIAEYRRYLHCTSDEVSLHRFFRTVFGVKDETIESIANPFSQTAKGIFSGIPIIGPVIGKAQELNLAPIVENIGEVLTYGTLSIPLAGLLLKAVNVPDVTLPGGLLAQWGIELGDLPMLGQTQLTFVALSAKGVVGVIINRKLVMEQGLHRILRADLFKKIPIVGKMSVKESLNVNRNDDVKAVLETRGL